MGRSGIPRKDGTKSLSKSKLRCASAKKDVLRLLQMGEHCEDITVALMDKYGYTQRSAEDIIKKANADMAAKYEKYANKVANQNIKRLNNIIEEAYDDNDLKTALSAIDTLNKTCGVYTQKLEVSTPDKISITFD